MEITRELLDKIRKSRTTLIGSEIMHIDFLKDFIKYYFECDEVPIENIRECGYDTNICIKKFKRSSNIDYVLGNNNNPNIYNKYIIDLSHSNHNEIHDITMSVPITGDNKIILFAPLNRNIPGSDRLSLSSRSDMISCDLFIVYDEELNGLKVIKSRYE